MTHEKNNSEKLNDNICSIGKLMPSTGKQELYSKKYSIQNNSKRNISSKPILQSNNIFRHGSNYETNNGNINYINLEVEKKNNNYSFNNTNNNKNLRGNRLNNGDDRIYNNNNNNFYNLNYSKRTSDKDNSNQSLNTQNKNIKNYENTTQNTLGYEYKGFKTFNFNK